MLVPDSLAGQADADVSSSSPFGVEPCDHRKRRSQPFMPTFDVMEMTLDVSTLCQDTVTLTNKISRAERIFATTEGGSGGAVDLLGKAFKPSWGS